MKTRKHGSFLYRFVLSAAAWTVFLCLFYLLAGFNRASDGRLDSLFVEWLSGMEMHLTFLSPHVIGYHYIALALALVGPPLTSAWAIPLIPTGSTPGRGDMDTPANSSRPGAARLGSVASCRWPGTWVSVRCAHSREVRPNVRAV